MIQHPTGKRPKSINLVALGPTNSDYHGAHFRYDPVVPPADEVWTVNKGFRTVKADLVFILDDLVGEAGISSRYARDINTAGIPIITSILDEQVEGIYPDSDLHAYPLSSVIDFWGEAWLMSQGGTFTGEGLARDKVREAGIRNACYLKNSIPMILAYAAAIGVRVINLFGADYDFPGSAIHEADKPNTEYWVGACRFGAGMLINVSSRTTLLSTNQGRDIYGYGKRQPVLS